MKVNQEIDDRRVADLLTCAFEGGSNYWCKIQDYVKPDEITFHILEGPDRVTIKHIDYPMSPGGAVLIRDTEGDNKKQYKLTRPKIVKGLQVFADSKTYKHHWADFMAENDDATTGDVFLQLCLFGDVLYG